MHKKLITAMAAMLMLTACAGDGNTEETTASESISETVSETISETETEALISEETTDSETESETEDQTEEKASSSVYDGNYYTITADSEKWTNANELRQAAGEVAESLDNGLDLSAEEYAEMCDALFYHNASAESGFTSNFNIVTQDMGVELDMDASILGPVMEENFNAVEGYECTGWEGITVNGYDCLRTDISAEQLGVKMKMQQYIFLKGGRETVITLTAAEEKFDEAFPDFEEVLNTIVLK